MERRVTGQADREMECEAITTAMTNLESGYPSMIRGLRIKCDELCLQALLVHVGSNATFNTKTPVVVGSRDIKNCGFKFMRRGQPGSPDDREPGD